MPSVIHKYRKATYEGIPKKGSELANRQEYLLVNARGNGLNETLYDPGRGVKKVRGAKTPPPLYEDKKYDILNRLSPEKRDEFIRKQKEGYFINKRRQEFERRRQAEQNAFDEMMKGKSGSAGKVDPKVTQRINTPSPDPKKSKGLMSWAKKNPKTAIGGTLALTATGGGLLAYKKNKDKKKKIEGE